jgi:putative endonuclease
MAWHNDLGKYGEELASQYLKKHGYRILETNWRYQRAEIDIIAMDGPVLVFIEVKSRSDNRFNQPEDSISPRKIELIADAATRYMESINHEWEIRFDIISLVIKSEEVYGLNHFKDSFFPGW